MPRDDLMHLPQEAKVLVNDGVYSLYSVNNRPGVRYVLVTNERQIYPLTPAGDVVPGVSIDSLTGLDLGEAIRFPDVPPHSTLTLNYAY
jgi:hypothetical protein